MMKRTSLVLVAMMMVAFGRASYAQQPPAQPAADPTAAAITALEAKITALTTTVGTLEAAVNGLPATDPGLAGLQTALNEQKALQTATQLKLDAYIALQLAAAAAAQPVPAFPPAPAGADNGSTVWGDPTEVPRFVPGGKEFTWTNFTNTHYRCVEKDVATGEVVRTHWFLNLSGVKKEEAGGQIVIRANKQKVPQAKPGYLVVFSVGTDGVDVVQVFEAVDDGKKRQAPIGDIEYVEGKPTLVPNTQHDATVAQDEVVKVAEALRLIGDDVAKSARAETAGSNAGTNGAATGTFNFVEKDAVVAFNSFTWVKK